MKMFMSIVMIIILTGCATVPQPTCREKVSRGIAMGIHVIDGLNKCETNNCKKLEALGEIDAALNFTKEANQCIAEGDITLQEAKVYLAVSQAVQEKAKRVLGEQ